MNILAHRRMALLSAGLVLMGTLGGCQTARYRTACATPESTSYGATAVPAPPEPNQVQEPPFLRGQSDPLPPSIPEEQLNRPVLPPMPVERPQARGLQGGPALNADPDELLDEDDRDTDDDSDEPIFPKGDRQPLRAPSQPRASVDPPGRATLSSTTRAVEQSAPQGAAPRYPLPVTRRLSSTAAAPRAASTASESDSIPLSMPIPLLDPPALLTPPTGRR